MRVIANNNLKRKHKKNHRDVNKKLMKDVFSIRKRRMIKKDEVINTIVDRLGIPEDIITGAEIISMVGRRNLVIENYVKVMEYENEKIVIRTKRNYIYIEGENLIIEYLLDNEVRISGKINSITVK